MGDRLILLSGVSASCWSIRYRYDAYRPEPTTRQGWVPPTMVQYSGLATDQIACIRRLNADGNPELLPVTLADKPLHNLNELEWVGDEIQANVWHTDHIARINPATGIVRVIDLSGLLAYEDRLRDTDVLNGIAINPEDAPGSRVNAGPGFIKSDWKIPSMTPH